MLRERIALLRYGLQALAGRVDVVQMPSKADNKCAVARRYTTIRDIDPHTVVSCTTPRATRGEEGYQHVTTQ